MYKRRIFINAIMSVVQIVLVSGILFFLYRFLLKTIGVEQLGIWSLVLATTSITQIANLGLSGSVVKFVAKYAARDEYNNVSGIIQTASISLAVIIALILLLGFPLIKLILTLVVPRNSIELSIKILPYSLISLWLIAITSVLQSGLDGLQKIYLRNILVITGSFLFAILCFILTPARGLIGLAYAQVINNSLILVASWVLIKRFLPALPVIPYKWSRRLLKEIIGYGVNFQIISITSMFYDPITKALLSKFGGLSMVGYYEMANKMIQHFRALIVSANQVLVPSIADLHEKNPERIRSVYLTNYNLLFYLALPFYTTIAISIPLISELWIGHYEKIFVTFGVLLAIASFLNTLDVPSYFTNLGTGDLRWNVIGHITTAILNAGLGIILGIIFGGFGVIIAWVIALSLGSAVIYVAYHITNKIPLSFLFPEDSRTMAGLCVLIIVSSFLIQSKFVLNISIIMLNIIVIIFIMLVMLYFHPMSKYLVEWILNDLIDGKKRYKR